VAAVALAAAARAGGPDGALLWNLNIGRYGLEIQNLTDEVSQRGDELVGVDRSACDEIVGGVGGKTHLVFGTQEDDVREGRLDCISDAPRSIETVTWALIQDVAQMS